MTSPRPAIVLMILTYAVGSIGVLIGYTTVQHTPPTLDSATLLAVGATGVLSFLRHAVWNRSDAIRGGWDYGVRNMFQIEVGIANLAWGVLAILAVVLHWGIRVEAATFLVSGLYFAGVSIMTVVLRDIRNRKIGGWIAITIWALVLIVLGVQGMSAA